MLNVFLQNKFYGLFSVLLLFGNYDLKIKKIVMKIINEKHIWVDNLLKLFLLQNVLGSAYNGTKEC